MRPSYASRVTFGAKLLVRALGFALTWAALIAAAQPSQQSLTPAQKAAIERVAAYASTGPDNVGRMLNSIGYNPNIPGFNAFPAVRKIETAYHAAEQEGPGAGKMVLALLSQQVREKYESAREDPTLTHYAALTANPSRLQFANPESYPKPDPQVTSAIATLADYADGNALGGPQAILRDYFGLPADRVYDILRNSDSTLAAITKGINWVPESERRRRLSDLVAEIDRAYDGAAMMEASLNEYRPKPPAKGAENSSVNSAEGRTHHKTPDNVVTAPHKPGDHPPGPSPLSPDNPLNPYTPNPPAPGGDEGGASGGGSSGDGSGESLTMANEKQGAENYREFLEDRYTGGQSELIPEPLDSAGGGVAQGIFNAIVEGEGGFGGIVFGNTVIESPVLGTLVSMSWIPSTSSIEDPQTGRLAFDLRQTSQGSSRLIHKFYGPVLLEDAYAAYRIIYSHDGVPVWSQGQGIGIMSLYDRQDYIDCDANRPSNQTAYWRTLLNPALLNSDLGQSAIMVDSLPIVQEKFASMIVRDDTSDLSDAVDDWLKTTPGTWKFIDRQMIVGGVGERITVRPAHVTNLPGDASRFIDVNAFEEDPLVAILESGRKESLFAKGFASLFPEIARGSHEFSRVNGFAPVLALFRWAKMSDAKFLGSIPVPTEIPTPEALLIDANSIQPAKDMPPKRIRELDRSNADQCLASITSPFPAPAASILNHEQSIWRNAALKLDPAADAGGQLQILLDRSEYLESLAKIPARQTPAGRDLLSKIAKAENEQDDSADNNSDDNSLPRLKRTLVEQFSPKKNLDTYDELIKQAKAQEAVVDERSKTYDEALRSALDDFALSKQLLQAVAPSDESKIDSIMDRETAAINELKSVEVDIDKLKDSLADAALACVQGLSPALQNQFEQSESDDAIFAFLSKHCTQWKVKTDEIQKQQRNLTERRQKAADAESATEKDLKELMSATLPKIWLWREFCTSYAPISYRHQELEDDSPRHMDRAEDKQSAVAPR